MIPTPPEYPKHLMIGVAKYEIVFVKKIRNDKNTTGLCDSGNKIIWIKAGQSHFETFATLIHEVFHAMELEYNISITHKHVYQLERAVSDFFIANLGRF